MKILFLSDNFPPEVNAPASRTFEHCREWVLSGNDVTVVTGFPNFPRGELFGGYRNRLASREIMDGIELVRVWTYITANEGTLKRTLDYLSFMVSGFIAALFLPRPDVVVGTSPQFFTCCAAWLVAVFKRAPFVFEVRDLWPESIRTVGAMEDSWALRLLERLELFLYRRAARVVVVTESFKRDLVRRGIAASKIDVVTNGVDLERFGPRDKDSALLVKHGLEGRFVAGYIGTHGLAHALETLLECAALLQEEPEGSALARCTFLLLGDGARKADLKARATELGLRNVVFVDTVPKDEVSSYWSLLDVSIIHLRREQNFTQVIPSKLFECMAMGIPVLHGVAGESADIVRAHGVGLAFEPENPVALRDALALLVQSASLRDCFAEKALAAAPEFDRRGLAKGMSAVLSLAAES